MTQTLILVTILLITQVTELKLLFETQVSQHRFYYVIMASLITCIAIEIVIGLVTVYVTQKRSEFWSRLTSDAKAKHPDPKADVYTGCHGKSSSGSNVRNIFSISGTCSSYTSLNRPSQYLGQVAQVVTSQVRPNLPFIDSPGTSCSSASQKLAPIPEDSPNSAAKVEEEQEEVIRVKVEGNEEDDEADVIHYTPGCACCLLSRKSRCDRDPLKSWHSVHFYLLYLIMVLNVFITAFGLSGENLRLQSEQK